MTKAELENLYAYAKVLQDALDAFNGLACRAQAVLPSSTRPDLGALVERAEALLRLCLSCSYDEEEGTP